MYLVLLTAAASYVSQAAANYRAATTAASYLSCDPLLYMYLVLLAMYLVLVNLYLVLLYIYIVYLL